MACQSAVTLRVQVGHEEVQPVAIVCPHCFIPIRLKLLLDSPPNVGVEFIENCEATEVESTVVNVGVGFMISRARLHDEMYFPSMDLPHLDEATLQTLVGDRREDAQGPLVLDLSLLLGGLPRSQDTWRVIRTAYRFNRTDQQDRMRAQLRLHASDEVPDASLTIERGLLSFLVRFLSPLGEESLHRLVAEAARIRQLNEREFARLKNEFSSSKWDRLDEYVDVFDHFFRAYEEFNQALLYVRRGLELPEDAYAASVDFESTRMYYGDAFEVLGSHIDLLASLNNVSEGRNFDQLAQISLRTYRSSDKGRRADTLTGNSDLKRIVQEYDNRLRNASHHRWLRLSHDRSEVSYREGGRGAVRTLSYATYLYRCCAITAQLMTLAAAELVILEE